MDSYAQPISLTYKQQNDFKTVPGGLFTLLSKFGILLYFLIQLPLVIQRDKDVSHRTVKVNLDDDSNPFTLDLENFDIGLRLVNLQGPLSDEFIQNRSRYFKFEVAIRRSYQAKTGYQSVTTAETIPLELGQCGADRFGNMTNMTTQLGIQGNGWVCPVNLNTSLLGSLKTLSRKALRVRVVPCNMATAAKFAADNVTCASDEEIDKAISTYFVQVLTYKRYFDENEFDESPIKEELDTATYNIAKNQSFFKGILVQRVNVTTKDSWFSSQFSSNQYSYFKVQDFVPPITGQAKLGIHDMLTLLYAKDENEEVITRQVTSITDILSKGGGFASFIIALTFFITQKFQISLFERSLTKRLFNIAFDESEQKQGHIKKPTNIFDEETPRGYDSRIARIIETIYYRKPLDINFFKMRLRGLFGSCFCTQKQKVQNKMVQKNLDAYTNALREEIDIVKLFKNVRKLKFLIYLLLSKQHRKLFPYLSFNLLTEQKIKKKMYKKAFGKNSFKKKSSLTPDKMAKLEKTLKTMLEGKQTRMKDKLMLKLIMDEWNDGKNSEDSEDQQDSFSVSNLPQIEIKESKPETLIELIGVSKIGKQSKGKVKEVLPSNNNRRYQNDNLGNSSELNDY